VTCGASRASLRAMTDDPVAILISDVAAQNRAAFRDLYAATSAKLFGVLLRMLGERAEAEDALQEVYTRVWLRAGRYEPTRARGMTWLIAISRNLAIDRLRARPEAGIGDEAVIDALPDLSAGVEQRIIASDQARRIAECFRTLEADKAAAVQGAYLSGLSYADLALRHNVPVNTMRTWLRRGLLKLKECLQS
jgi:RNA polymerase sigma-70 factor, ECF subfamily